MSLHTWHASRYMQKLKYKFKIENIHTHTGIYVLAWTHARTRPHTDWDRQFTQLFLVWKPVNTPLHSANKKLTKTSINTFLSLYLLAEGTTRFSQWRDKNGRPRQSKSLTRSDSEWRSIFPLLTFVPICLSFPALLSSLPSFLFPAASFFSITCKELPGMFAS